MSGFYVWCANSVPQPLSVEPAREQAPFVHFCFDLPFNEAEELTHYAYSPGERAEQCPTTAFDVCESVATRGRDAALERL